MLGLVLVLVVGAVVSVLVVIEVVMQLLASGVGVDCENSSG